MCLSTGNRYLDIGIAVVAAVATSGGSLAASATTITGAAVQGASLATQLGVAMGATTFGGAAALGGLVMGVGSSIAMSALTPQQQNYNLANTGMPYAPQAYSSQHATVTGSGGRQAAAVLASEIKQAKSLRKRQAEAVEDYGLGMDMAGTGLQIA